MSSVMLDTMARTSDTPGREGRVMSVFVFFQTHDGRACCCFPRAREICVCCCFPSDTRQAAKAVSVYLDTAAHQCGSIRRESLLRSPDSDKGHGALENQRQMRTETEPCLISRLAAASSQTSSRPQAQHLRWRFAAKPANPPATLMLGAQRPSAFVHLAHTSLKKEPLAVLTQAAA